MAALGIIGAIGIGAWLAHEYVEQGEREAAYRAANGWSFGETAAGLFGEFDRDHDGRIATAALSGGRSGREALRETVRGRLPESVSGVLALNTPRGTKVEYEDVTIRTIDHVLARADTNRDGVVTRAEMVFLAAAYDVNRDGKLDYDEHQRALREMSSVVLSTHKRVKRIVVPPAAPTPVKR